MLSTLIVCPLKIINDRHGNAGGVNSLHFSTTRIFLYRNASSFACPIVYAHFCYVVIYDFATELLRK